MKYKFTGEIKIINGGTLRRIRRLSDNAIGGWIEKESNLSQSGGAWVCDNARVSGGAWVCDNARVSGGAWVCDNARVSGDARVYESSQCISVSNLEYRITVTPQNIAIGCQLKTHKEWLNITKKQAVEMGLKAENYNTFKSLLKILIKKVLK